MSDASPLRKALVGFYYRSLRWVCPGLRNSQFAYREALERVVHPGARWLDLGCGHQIFPEWMPEAESIQRKLVGDCASVIGVDSVDLRPHLVGITKIGANIEQLPFADDTFSLITANMVVEHVEYPERLLREVRRVLKPGGLFLLHTPNSKFFEVVIVRHLPSWMMKWIAGLMDGRAGEDIFPTYYRLNTANDISRTAQECGLQIEFVRHVECTAQGIMLGPLVFLELLVIRALRLSLLEQYRSDLVALMQKPAGSFA